MPVPFRFLGLAMLVWLFGCGDADGTSDSTGLLADSRAEASQVELISTALDAALDSVSSGFAARGRRVTRVRVPLSQYEVRQATFNGQLRGIEGRGVEWLSASVIEAGLKSSRWSGATVVAETGCEGPKCTLPAEMVEVIPGPVEHLSDGRLLVSLEVRFTAGERGRAYAQTYVLWLAPEATGYRLDDMRRGGE